MNILLTSVGRRSYLAQYFREALNGTGLVIGANAVAKTCGLMACDAEEITPFAYDPDYIPALLNICEQYDIKLLFSLHDLDAPFIAEAREEFEVVGTMPVVADRQFIDIALDKLRTAEFLAKHGLGSPTTWLSVDQAVAGVEAGQGRFPLIVKPRWGFGSIGLQTVHTADELQWAWSSVMATVNHSWIPHTPRFDAAHAVMIQQVVRGQEYGVDIVNDLNNRYVTTFAEYKIAMRAGETDIAEIVEEESLTQLGQALGQMGRHPGILDVDVIVEDGTLHVIELNPRFGGHYPFAHLAGANIPAALIAWARHEQPDPTWLRAEVGVRCYKDLVPKRVT